jgi:signal transduction histidine kinase/CheY-like chemotaxis protein
MRERVGGSNQKMRKLLALDFVVFLLLFLVIGTTVMTSYFGMRSTREHAEVARRRLINAANAATIFSDLDLLDQIQSSEDYNAPWYQEFKQKLIDFAEDNIVLWVYFVRMLPDGSTWYICDNDTNPDTMVTPELAFQQDSASVLAFQGQTASTEYGEYENVDYLLSMNIVTEMYDTEFFLSGYAPLFREDGSVDTIVGVDVVAQSLIEQSRLMNTLLLVQVTVAILVFATGIISTIMYRRRTIESMSASDAKSAFLANMSHEMRTPMNAIIGMTQVALRADTAQEKDDCLQKVSTASRHLLGIINDVLDMSKIEANKLAIHVEPFNLRQTIQNIEIVTGMAAGEKRQQFTVWMDDRIPASLIGDEQRFSQVITNLLSNATKFTPEGGRISLLVEQLDCDDAKVRLSVKVQDTGIGISQAQQKSLFTAFEQAEKDTTRKYGGTGLGLALSKKLAEMMGGEISLVSEMGQGSTFTFICVFERGEHTEAAPEDAPETADIPRFAGKRILLAEDSPINREIVAALLEPTEIEIIEAEDGAAAVEAFRAGGIDLILMDIQMPGTDGYEATRLIRALDAPGAQTVPIIAITANVFKEDVERSLASGMNDHIGKPIDLDDMLTKLRKYLK